jgi:ribosomal protein L11 methylase PrmA
VPARSPASFRDPDGFVFRRDGLVHRQVQESYRADYEALMGGGLYDALVREQLLLPHTEVDRSLALDEGAFKVLLPEQLEFVSHPYEWCFSQLRDAALATLRIQQLALAHGMSMKDASAYNIQFHRGRAVCIDTLSFERLRAGEPWVAYRQFCQHFLAPLALQAKVDVRLGQLLRSSIDGVPLDLASRLLPRRSLLTLSLGLHVHAHARAQSKFADAKLDATRKRSATFSKRSFEALLESLRSAVEGLNWRSRDGEWGDYYEANHNYGSTGLETKRAALAQVLGRLDGQRVWDLGANVGRFTRVALELGARHAVAWDIEHACVEANYRQTVAARETALLPLHLDLTNPSPALGWAHEERASFAGRGPADVVLALGLVHHLAISNNVPLEHVARFLASVARTLVIEWVPKEDSQVQRLLATRRDVFGRYERSAFEADFARHFEVAGSLAIEGTQRTLYRMGSKAR